jgi:flagellar basal-body rod protein FlgB
MDIKEPALNRMMKGHMKYMTERQRVLAQNIANIDTPGYKARDLEKVDFGKLTQQSMARISMRQTSPMHLTPLAPKSSDFRDRKDDATFETTPTQNNVVLEDQMAKISDTGAHFNLSSSMLRKYTQLYRRAAGSNQ